MAPDTITLMLEGEVSLEVFSTAVKSLNNLVKALSMEEGGDIEWTIEDLQPGSALATIKGKSKQSNRVNRVVRNYTVIGMALQESLKIERGPKITRPALELGRLVGNGVSRIRFETSEVTAIISEKPGSRRKQASASSAKRTYAIDTNVSVSLGVVEGEVQTLLRRQSLRFTLYEFLSDRAVSCYLKEGQEETMREVWGKQALVEGWISRDPTDGHPIAVRQVSRITPIVEEGDYTLAGNILPLEPGEELPEVRIRQSRDD